jgi:Zn-dependent protease
MDSSVLIDGLIFYIGLVVLLTFHEFGHAWMALKCGDDTAQQEGRCSLNPLVHIDPIGTVLMPLLQIFLPAGMGRFLIGWAKPVPVNISNLRNPKLDDILISMAGPWMNLLLAVVFIGAARVGLALESPGTMRFCLTTAHLSLLLCFFNLIPIPPLDGSRVVRILVGMSFETYMQIARFSYFLIMAVLLFTPIPRILTHVTNSARMIIQGWFGL